MAKEVFWKEDWPQIIAKQESVLRYEHFNRDMAFELGMTIRDLALNKYKKGCAIRIIEDGVVIFALKLDGTYEENDWWMNRKLAVTRMTGTSSLRAYVDAKSGLRRQLCCLRRLHPRIPHRRQGTHLPCNGIGPAA